MEIGVLGSGDRSPAEGYAPRRSTLRRGGLTWLRGGGLADSNQRVQGSSPCAPTNIINNLRDGEPTGLARIQFPSDPASDLSPRLRAYGKSLFRDASVGSSDWPICHQLCRLPQLRDALDNAAAFKGPSTRLLMPSDRAARPCRFYAPELSVIVHDFMHQLFDQLLSDRAVLMAS